MYTRVCFFFIIIISLILSTELHFHGILSYLMDFFFFSYLFANKCLSNSDNKSVKSFKMFAFTFDSDISIVHIISFIRFFFSPTNAFSHYLKRLIKENKWLLMEIIIVFLCEFIWKIPTLMKIYCYIIILCRVLHQLQAYRWNVARFWLQ